MVGCARAESVLGLPWRPIEPGNAVIHAGGQALFPGAGHDVGSHGDHGKTRTADSLSRRTLSGICEGKKPQPALLNLYDDFAHGLTRFHRDVRLKSGLQRKPLRAQQRCQLARLGELGCCAQNVSVVGSSLTRQHRQQSEDVAPRKESGASW
jgi:hypothetical protein